MKAVIIYYSLEGNTDLIAKKIATRTGAELIRLIPKKEYPTGKVSKYVWGGKSAMFGERPRLEKEEINLQQYDTIILGTPIWASRFAPPFNTFLYKNEIKGKKVYLFACHGGGGAEKCFTKMKELLGSNTVLGTMDFLDPFAKPKNDTDEKVDQIVKVVK